MCKDKHSLGDIEAEINRIKYVLGPKSEMVSKFTRLLKLHINKEKHIRQLNRTYNGGTHDPEIRTTALRNAYTDTKRG